MMINKNELLRLVKELCQIDGISGDEGRVREYIINEIKGICRYKVDALGSVIGTVKGGSELLVTAHMDEVGMIVTSVGDDGFIGFDTVGGIDERLLPDKRVDINGKIGVISVKPVHLMSNEEKKKALSVNEMYIDIGAKDENEAAELVSLGDSINFEREYFNFGNGFICSPALDDRIGCAVLICLIKYCKKPFSFAFTVQEEVGTRGAYAAAFAMKPAVAIAIEATTAADVPDVEEDKNVARLGDGAALSFMDRATVYDRDELKRLIEIAEADGIKWQYKRAVAGGNDMGAIHKTGEGAKPIAISVPARYLHSPSVVVKEEDIISVYRLTERYIEVF